MAKLKAPTKAYQDKDNKRSKWHLSKGVALVEDMSGMSACGLIIWDADTVATVRSLKADDICKKCLGAMEVRDG